MDNVQKNAITDYNAPSSEPFGFSNKSVTNPENALQFKGICDEILVAGDINIKQ
jgi:hypothetical protein